MFHFRRLKHLLTMSEEEWQMIQLVFRMTLRQYTLYERICGMSPEEVDELMTLTSHTLEYPEDPEDQEVRLQLELKHLFNVANRRGMYVCTVSKYKYMQLYEERFKKIRKQYRELLKAVANDSNKEKVSKILDSLYFKPQE